MIADLNLYSEFVKNITSNASNELETMIDRLRDLSTMNPPLNTSLVITGYTGMTAETGEFTELFKKIIFQGKPWNEDVRKHAILELSDIIFYWINACRAIGVNPNEVIEANIEKLKARYPGGTFNVYHSENRKEGDL